MDRLYNGPLGSNDPFVPVDIKGVCAELNADNSELAKNWKHVSITKWMSLKDKSLYLSCLFGIPIKVWLNIS